MSPSSDAHDDVPADGEDRPTSDSTGEPGAPTRPMSPPAPSLPAPSPAPSAPSPAPPAPSPPVPLSPSPAREGWSAPPFGARPGDLTIRWRLLVGAAWIAAFFAYSAVWQASVQIGIGTWWLGPRAQPTNTLVRVAPFVLCIAMALCSLYNVSRLLWLSMLGVALAVVISVPDFSRSVGLGVAELAIAGLVGLVTAAAFTGRYRLAPAAGPPPAALLEPVATGADAATVADGP